jgi:hypothetical protein
MARNQAFEMIAEMKEFATFGAASQRYIRRSLEVAGAGLDAAERWSRNSLEQASIAAQERLYRTQLPLIRASIPDDIAVDAAADIIAPLITLAGFDLGEGKLGGFADFRFLYERLLGGAARPWLPSAFVAAAALPSLHPQLRKSLLGTITAGDVGAAGWSHRDAVFVPEWVEKVPVVVA